jgi:TonB family protein
MNSSSRTILVWVLSIVLHMLVLSTVDFSQWKVELGPPGPARVEVIVGDAEGDISLPEFIDANYIPVEAPQSTPEPEPEPTPEPEPEELDGQLVEIPPPKNQTPPQDADYVAEYNSTVPKETRTAGYRVNPEVLANIYSREDKVAMENTPDVGATESSSGATVGNLDTFEPGPGAPRSTIPSPYTVTNKPGVAAPTIGSSGDAMIAGAPQNDRLNEALGDQVALNARQLIGAEYFNRIRRLVNYYWVQNLENLPVGTVISKSSYRTVVEVVVTAEGLLESVIVTDESGSTVVDRCLLDAIRVAAPFPNPPEQLVARDGRVYLPDFDFEVNFRQAHNQYQGIDPRSGVQFPGILKNPR